MTILLDTPVPETGHLSVRVHADVQIRISAVEAQRRVTHYVHRKISSQMHAGPPALILSQRVCWRVPVHLTFPSVGDAGSVGNIDVDVDTGEPLITPAVVEEIERHAEDLARRITSAPASRV